MKPTFIALLAVLLCVGGCGKKKVEQAAKETLKTKKAPENAKPKPPSVNPGTVQTVDVLPETKVAPETISTASLCDSLSDFK